MMQMNLKVRRIKGRVYHSAAFCLSFLCIVNKFDDAIEHLRNAIGREQRTVQRDDFETDDDGDDWEADGDDWEASHKHRSRDVGPDGGV